MEEPQDEIQDLLSHSPPTLNLDQPRLVELLPQLAMLADLLAEAPDPIAGPALLFRGRDGQVVAHPVAGRLRVGRAAECEISFPKLREVSRLHFEILGEEGRMYLVDGGSANGTFVRGHAGRITRHELRDGDVIEAAGFKFIFLRH